MSIRKFAIATAAAALAVSASGAAWAQTQVNVALDWAFLSYQAPFTIPVDDGTFADLGLDVTVDRGGGSVDSISKVASGSYDFGHADMYAVAQFNAQNPERPVIGVMLTHDRALVTVTTLKSSGIETPADLAGRTIAAPAGDSSRQLFPVFAELNGLDPSSVSWLDVTADLRETLLIQGSTDAISGQLTTVVPNLLSRGVSADDFTVMAYADYGLNFYGHMVITRPEFAEANPDVVTAFLTGMAHGFNVTYASPEAAYESIVKRDAFLDRDVELSRLELASSGFFTENVLENGLSSPDMEHLQDSLASAAEIFGFDAPDVSTVYDDSYLPARELLQIQQ
ncbi:ABC transporter substrate-binding protein [Pelagibacterium lacus]|uniref:Thiamine pyrimidine synthase n=1 Tax=Pelagibacterium lacus TaxID=2282655 RepID=A0A369W9Q6_9HYPH|nr:ABC transporter substrate-binding protein [Pelagibacterium lacus]RDE10090.1 taurine ABC transporter permease [Pelagibacterium lacus]